VLATFRPQLPPNASSKVKKAEGDAYVEIGAEILEL
jgi:hypothetical protein